MACGGDSIVLVTCEGRTREVEFFKSDFSYEKLLKRILEEFEDIPLHEETISHIEIWKTQWDNFVELRPKKFTSDVKDGCKLKVILKTVSSPSLATNGSHIQASLPIQSAGGSVSDESTHTQMSADGESAKTSAGSEDGDKLESRLATTDSDGTDAQLLETAAPGVGVSGVAAPRTRIRLTVEPHFSPLYKAANPAKNAWTDIGVSLGFAPHELESIEKDKPGDVGACFRVMLTRWLERGKDCYLDKFVEALKNAKKGSLVDDVVKAATEAKLENGSNKPTGSIPEHMEESAPSQLPKKNPSYPHVELPSSTLNTLYDKSYDARHVWWNIGMALGIKENDLKAIDMNNQKEAGKCYCEMLSRWLQSRNNCFLDSFLNVLEKQQVYQSELSEPIKEAVLKELLDKGALSLAKWREYTGAKRKRLSSSTEEKPRKR